ncbi:MAG: hypothetical protein WC538_19870 [Thermoanaerobaculia bacterium]|jgi:hypothetical protein
MRIAGSFRALVIICFAGAAAASLSGDPRPADSILGEWRGTSICTNRELAPACKDESIVYLFTPLPSDGAPKVHLDASKIVDGKAAPMGEFDLTWDAGDASWSAEIRTPRVHALWSYTIDGDHLTGTLAELPSKAQLRKVDATRQTPSK